MARPAPAATASEHSTARRTAHAPDVAATLGWLGLEEHVEPVLRRIVCGYFGIAWEDVHGMTQLRGELDASSLDLAR
ncbi:MAG: hypothetical protein ACREQL_14260, partial [Candidatus Binatia bacterium]